MTKYKKSKCINLIKPFPFKSISVSPESIVIPIVSCIFGFPILALLVICCLRRRAKLARERDRRRNYDMQDHAVSLVRFSPIHRLSEFECRNVLCVRRTFLFLVSSRFLFYLWFCSHSQIEWLVRILRHHASCILHPSIAASPHFPPASVQIQNSSSLSLYEHIAPHSHLTAPPGPLPIDIHTYIPIYTLDSLSLRQFSS